MAAIDGAEWEPGALDLPAYLARIGHRGGLEPTVGTLRAIHAAHLAAIPFENLDVVLGRGIAVDLRAVQDKLVRRRRGGYCYEHGILLGAVLDRLGFRVDRLLARVGDDPGRIAPRSHLVLSVEAGGRRWLADVGFGSGLLEPVPLAAAGPWQQGPWTFDVASAGPGAWSLRERRPGGWEVLYTLTEEPQHWIDVDVANHYTSTHPTSPFVRGPVAVARTRREVVRLRGRDWTVTRPDGTSTTSELDDEELVAVLTGTFGLPLEAQELAALRRWAPEPASGAVVAAGGRQGDGGQDAHRDGQGDRPRQQADGGRQQARADHRQDQPRVRGEEQRRGHLGQPFGR